MKKLIKKHWLTILILSLIIGLGFILIAVLSAVNIIKWSWISGYSVGILAFLALIPLITMSVKILILNENIYFYLLLFLVRLGVVFVPFLFAIYFPDSFSVFGILVAIVPYVTFTIYRYFTNEHGGKIKGGK